MSLAFCLHFVTDRFSGLVYTSEKMNIPNYDPDFASMSNYKQGYPYMSTDVFRMLICGSINSRKANILLHMLYRLLVYEKVYTCFQEMFIKINTRQCCKIFAWIIDPQAGYEVIQAPGDEIIPLEELPVDNQKIVVFDDLVCESNQNAIINYFINGRYRNCSVVYLTQTYYKVPKNIHDNCSNFCIFKFLPIENRRIADELGVDHELLDSATEKPYSLFYRFLHVLRGHSRGGGVGLLFKDTPQINSHITDTFYDIWTDGYSL